MNWRSPRGSVAIILLLVIAFLVGVMAIDVNEERAPAIITGGITLLLGMVWVRIVAPKDQFSDVFRIFLIAWICRIVVCVTIHYVMDWGFFATDDYAFSLLGERIAAVWSGDSYGDIRYSIWAKQRMGNEVGYAYVVAFFYFIFGKAPLVPKVFNCFVGSMTVVYFTKFAWETCGATAGRLTGFICAIFPSLVLWSTLALKDPIASFCVVYAVYMAFYLQKRFEYSILLRIALALVVLGQVRGYMFVLVSGSIVLGVVLRQFKHLARNMVLGMILLGILFYLFQTFGFGKRFTTGASFVSLDNYRRSLVGGNSALHMDADVSSPGRAAAYLPIGVLYFLFAPFPWAVAGARQLFALPEVLVWYGLFPFFIRGLVFSVKNHFRSFAPAISSAGLITLTYSLVEGNLGTAYRHRSQIMGFYLMFTAIGIALFMAQRARKPDLVLRQSLAEPATS